MRKRWRQFTNSCAIKFRNTKPMILCKFHQANNVVQWTGFQKTSVLSDYLALFACRLFRSVFGRRSWRSVPPHIVVIPSKVALQTILYMGWRRKFMILIRINDQLSGAAQAFQRLVHLLAINDRDVPVDIAAHNQSRGGDTRNPI